MDEKGRKEGPDVKEKVTEIKKDWKKHGVYWDTPQGSEHCLAHGAREYSAQLQNISFSADWRDACQNSQAKIHNTIFESPTRCEKRVRVGVQGMIAVLTHRTSIVAAGSRDRVLGCQCQRTRLLAILGGFQGHGEYNIQNIEDCQYCSWFVHRDVPQRDQASEYELCIALTCMDFIDSARCSVLNRVSGALSTAKTGGSFVRLPPPRSMVDI